MRVFDAVYRTVAEKYIRVFRSLFAVRRHLCLAFFVRASRFAVRASRFAVRRHLCLAFFVRASRFAVRRHLCLAFFVRASRFAVRSHLCLAFFVRASRFALSHSRFVLSRSCFAVRSSQFVVVLEQGGGSIYHRLFLRRKCAEQSECPVRRVTVDGMF